MHLNLHLVMISGLLLSLQKQFKRPDLRKEPNQNKQTCSKAGDYAAEGESSGVEERQIQKKPVHERIRVPVSYDDLLQTEDPKDI